MRKREPETEHQWLTRVTALANGCVPDGVDPESLQGKHYAVIARKVKADLDAAPPMTSAQKSMIVTLLRGGGHASTSA